jgi:hypothetical protein
MKTNTEVPVLVLKMEKDHPENTTGMQLKAWLLNNKTEVLVRLYKHDHKAEKTLWNGTRTCGEVDDMVIELLWKMSVIKDITNWNSTAHRRSQLQQQDEIEEKKECYIYFSWFVKPELINY